MKKITFFIALFISAAVYSQSETPKGSAPTTSAPVPTRLQANVVSVFSDSYASIATNFNPAWDQTGKVNSTYNPGDGNLCLAYTNFNYQGTEVTTTNLSTMEFLHVDVWTNKSPADFKLHVTPINQGGVGEVLVLINHVQGGWYSVDIPKSSFTGMTWNAVFQMKFAANGLGSTPPGDIYLDNIYFWKTPAAAGTPNIGLLNVPAKIVGDAAFMLTDPTSDSPGAFSYTSSNTAVARISGKTVTIVGAGTSEITATQAASGTFIAGSVKANLVVTNAPPAIAAPTPPVRPTNDVIAIYSDAYTPIVINNFDAGWCGGVATTEVKIANNNTLQKNSSTTCHGIDFASNRQDLSAFTHLHFDFYITDSDLTGDVFNVKLVNFNKTGGETSALEVNINTGTTPKLVANQWVSIDVDITKLGGVVEKSLARNDIAQIGITTANVTNVWYDNIYLHKGNLSTSKFQAANVKMYPNPAKNIVTIEAQGQINKVAVYNVLGKEVLSSNPKSNSTTLQTNPLSKGLYIVTAEIDGKLSTSKLVIE